jgi:hypothetical protein
MTTDDNDTVDGFDNDSGLLEPDESLDDARIEDVLDEGYSPPERPYAVNDWGFTASEASGHESLEGRLAREIPEDDKRGGDDLGDSSDTDGELYDDEVGTERAGRLIETGGDDEDFFAVDVGVDGGAASAEEAAVHLVPDESDY